MKTRKAFAAMALAVFSLSLAAWAFAQSATSGTTTATPKPAPAATATKPAAKEAEPAKVGPRTVIGEVVDPACWIVNGAKGASHKECAIACAKAGQVLAIVETKSQKLFLVATDKPGDDPNKGLIDYVGQIVTVKGRVYTRGGATGIKVSSVEPYKAAASVPQ